MELLRDYRNEARQLEARFADEAAKVAASKELTQEGKQKRLRAIEDRRTAALRELQDEASRVVQDARNVTARQLADERAKVEAGRRSVLGDALYAQVLQTELAVASAGEILQLYEDAATDFDRTLLQSYGTVELRRRTAERQPTLDEYEAAQALRLAVPERVRELEGELRQLDAFDVSSLDRRAAVQELAAVYGLRAQSVPDEVE